jgi:hypothetical protein
MVCPTAADQERLAYILANQLIKNLMKKYIFIAIVFLAVRQLILGV